MAHLVRVGLQCFSSQKTRLISLPLNNSMFNQQQTRLMSSHKKETDEEFDSRWETYFNRPNIDGWDIRQGINHMHRLDLIPEPRIIIACLNACKRVNDHSLAVRYLEAIRHKSTLGSKQIWPWILQEIEPTLKKLGVSTPEDLGYDKPELALKSVEEA
ncbi:unnamed protein product [Didymodactylos carnosus]|uniref:Cytochrome c oxidase subunit 5A, mitochondrial n=1 Tax=Didymodactylos carnosus TaxID=1234261 RepID=A0A813TYM5_9BILA|nr:unnamed protein product [Didymodactylos carnosus]CAF0815873.1 unnamed protein product [Didymodactylos carnosus]CAF3575751.1 unnamed protein product [Didymodactylos carnosus]CAF3601957.1 unnamed protein product [Didymodactylos carnosus]